MSFKMEWHSKWKFIKNGVSLKMECPLKLTVTQNGMSFKMERHSKWNVTQNGILLKTKCHLK